MMFSDQLHLRLRHLDEHGQSIQFVPEGSSREYPCFSASN